MSEPAENIPAEDLVARVRAVAPLVAEHAAQAERERKPVDAVIAALERTGVFKSYVPRRFGGYEIDTDTFIDIGSIVSEACPSTGWVTTFYMEHNWLLAQFPPETQTAIFGAQPYVLAPASISPNGRAEPVTGGYRIEGRWQWGTGVVHADWALLNGMAQGATGDVMPRLFLVPRDEIAVEDTWYSAGMEGTGSRDMIATDLFVATERSADLLTMAAGRGPGAEWHGSPCYRHPMLPLLSIAAATPALGAARAAVRLFRERLEGRVLLGTASKQRDRPSAQIGLGNVAVRVQAAETVLRQVGRDLTGWGARDDACPREEHARLVLTVAHVVRACRDVVRDVLEASGAGAHMRAHPLQRLHRDVHTMCAHTVFDTDLRAENYGRLLLGMDPASLV